MGLLQATVFWQLWELTRSEWTLAGVGGVRFLPHLAFTLVGGAVADSFDRRRVALLGLLALALCSAGLFAATVRGAASPPLVLALVFAVGVAAAFESPSRTALLPTLVPREVFPNAVTVNSTVTQVAAGAGPAISGLLIAWAGVAASYAANVLLVLLSAAALACVRPRGPVEARGSVRWSAIAEGLRFVRDRQAVLGAMTLDMFAVIFGGATALIPVYATEILEVGPRGYGLLAASLEIGAFSTAVLLVFLPPIQRVGRALLLAVAAFGLATIVFGLSRSFPLSVAAYMAVGVADQVSVVTRHTLIQLATPDALRGRVSAVNGVFIGASNHLGAVEAGFVAALTSATFAVVSGGVGCLAVLGIVAVKLPELGRHRLDAAP